MTKSFKMSLDLIEMLKTIQKNQNISILIKKVEKLVDLINLLINFCPFLILMDHFLSYFD